LPIPFSPIINNLRVSTPNSKLCFNRLFSTLSLHNVLFVASPEHRINSFKLAELPKLSN